MAMFPGLFAVQLADLLASLIKDVAPPTPDALQEINQLQDKLQMIRAVMGDDEMRMEDGAIHPWVRKLKDVMYDADDVIDLCRLEFLQQMPSLDQPSPAPPVRCPQFSILPCFTRVVRRYEIATSLRKINHRLEEISQLRDLSKLAVDPKVKDPDVSRRTSSILISDDVVGVGIEEDAREMIGRLLKEHNKLPGTKIFAITGMGGIGKTTLAQKIYSDYTIKNHFEIRVWVSVSRFFSETDLLRGIISIIRGESSTYSAHSKEQLQEILFTAIQGRRFFLVLDDVWSTEVWEHVLRNPFQGGDPGSRIIVTTRDEDVAKRIGAVHLHRVTPLSNEDSWELLCKTAFMGEDDVKDIDRLRDIGLKIVNKCEGLPLALKVAGVTLRAKERSQREWEKVFKSLTSFNTRFNREFMGALYLSYEALPSHLRPCFLYCSLFLENRIIARRELVQMWIAEGFVKSHPDSTLEEVAEGYCAQIADYSLLRLEIDDTGADAGYRMHDVLRDLALNLAEGDSYAGDLGKLSVSEGKLRRLSIASGVKINSSTTITNQKSLRTLLIFDSPLGDEALRDLLNQLGHLRVLDLRGTEIKEVPSSLGKLLHLRYLNLSRTRIRALPSSIKELRYLQFLNLNGCTNLKHLPTGITHLHNLRNLDLLHTEVDQIPSGVGRIKNLNTLLGYAVRRGEPASEELKNLNQLRDLNIRKLERAKSNKISPLQDKYQLRSLVLSCHHPAANSSLMPVFEELRPPVCLEQLTIECYFGTDFPTWMFSPSEYANLVQLNLKSCTFCRKLPPLGRLPQLKYLCISASLEIVSIDIEFFGESGHSFPKLERLVIQDMPNWEEWQGPESGALPLLKQMYLSKCPKLRSLPRCLQYSTALTQLVIEAADSIRAIEGLASVTQLRLDDCPNLEKISFLPALKTLQIIKCPLLEAVRDVQALQHLVLEDFTLESLPEWFTSNSLTKLDTLDVTGNRDFLVRLQTDGADWHKIAYIPHVNARPRSPKESTYFAYTKGAFSFNRTVTETTEHDSRGSESGEITHLDD